MTREIPLSRGLVAVVDDEDYDHVMSVGKWYADPARRTFYARKNIWVEGKCKQIKMHKFITGWEYVDHVNRNGLDNRRANLRRATDAQNARNRSLRSDNTTGYKGVSFHKAVGRYTANISVKGARHYLGLYDDPADAARAYDEAALKWFGTFAHLNFPASLPAFADTERGPMNWGPERNSRRDALARWLYSQFSNDGPSRLDLAPKPVSDRWRSLADDALDSIGILDFPQEQS